MNGRSSRVGSGLGKDQLNLEEILELPLARFAEKLSGEQGVFSISGVTVDNFRSCEDRVIRKLLELKTGETKQKISLKAKIVIASLAVVFMSLSFYLGEKFFGSGVSAVVGALLVVMILMGTHGLRHPKNLPNLQLQRDVWTPFFAAGIFGLGGFGQYLLDHCEKTEVGKVGINVQHLLGLSFCLTLLSFTFLLLLAVKISRWDSYITRLEILVDKFRQAHERSGRASIRTGDSNSDQIRMVKGAMALGVLVWCKHRRTK